MCETTTQPSIPTALGAAAQSVGDLRRAFPNGVLNAMSSPSAKLGRASPPLEKAHLPLAAVPRAGSTHILSPAPQVSVQRGFPCTQHTTYPLGWLVLPPSLDGHLESPGFPVSGGSFHYKQNEEMWGRQRRADAGGWREGSMTIKNQRRREPFGVRRAGGAYPICSSAPQYYDEKQQDS